MIDPAFEILNQRGTPMFFSDTFANRPTAGIVGRIFISTDTKEFYRDTGSTWELLGGPGAGTITGSGTTGTLSKFTSSSSIGDSIVSEIGSAITINGTGKATNWYVGTPTDLTRAFSASGNANNVAIWLEEYGNTPSSGDVFMFKGRGTESAKANIQVGDNAGAISTGGYINGNLLTSANWFAEVVNVDTINNHADSDWKLTQTYNSAGTTENFRIRAIDGYVVAPNGGFETTGNINLLAAANSRNIVFSANAGVSRTFAFKTGSSSRFDLVVDGAETGSNAGGNLSFQRYNDAGSLIDSPFSIIRSTGQTFVGSQTTASGLLVVNNASSDAHIQVVGASAPSIRIDNAGTGATQRLVFGLATATNNFIQGSTAGDICISTASASPLLFGMWQTINASEVMRITTSNNISIGYNVDLGYKLYVNGAIGTNGSITIGNGGTGTSYIYALSGSDLILNAGGDRMVVRQTGNVGINTLSPSFKLDISVTTNDGIRSTSSAGQQSYLGNTGGEAVVGTLNNYGFGIITNGSTRLTIASTGAATFSSSVTAAAFAPSYNTSYYATDGTISNYDALNYLYVNGNAGGGLFLKGEGTGINNIKIESSTLNLISFQTNSSERMRITSVGNVGIGNSGSNAKLEVSSSTGEVFRADAASGAYRIYANQNNVFLGGNANVLVNKNVDTGEKFQVNGTSLFTNGISLSAIFSNDASISNYNSIELRGGTAGTAVNWQISKDNTLADSLQFTPSTTAGGTTYTTPTLSIQTDGIRLNGKLRIDGQSSGTAGGSSGQHLIINLDGTTYKIALLNP